MSQKYKVKYIVVLVASNFCKMSLHISQEVNQIGLTNIKHIYLFYDLTLRTWHVVMLIE